MDAESFDSQDIQQHWRRVAKEKKKNALLLQQGNQRYVSEENQKLHLLERLDHIETFQYDTLVPVHQRLKDFKANNFKSGVRLKKEKEKESKVRAGKTAVSHTEANQSSESESNSSKEDVSAAYFKKIAAAKHRAESKYPHLETEQARNI